uniref:PDZ domain-containing protein n=1 Tax=Hymenolepis diminuta TaxID=6216 RepID=A0A0R3SGV8_HYMDI
LVVARVIRPHTPEMLRSGSGEIFMDFGGGGNGSSSTTSTSAATRSPGTAVPPPATSASVLPSSLKSPSTRLCREQEITVEKMPGESLGMTVAGGVASQRGDTPVYITNLVPTGVLGRAGQLAKGDVLLAVNEIELLGLSHEKAVEALKATRKTSSKVTIRVLEGPETSSGRENFLPSWLYWLQLPRYCQIPRTIILPRTANGSLGFSIVGGNTAAGSDDSGTSPLTAFSREAFLVIGKEDTYGVTRLTNSWRHYDYCSLLLLTKSFKAIKEEILWGYAVTDVGIMYCNLPEKLVTYYNMGEDSKKVKAFADPFIFFQSVDFESRHPSATHGSSSVTSSPQPIVVKSIVPGSPAHRDGRLKCGDLILAVNQYPLTDVSHAHAVALLKHCVGDVHIRVVSWPGTIV